MFRVRSQNLRTMEPLTHQNVRKINLGTSFRSMFWPIGAPSRSQNRQNWSLGAVGAPLGRPWAARSAPSRFYEGSPHQQHNSKVDILAEMVAPRVEFGALAVPRGAPKSYFLVKNQHQIAKKSLQERFQKKHEKLIEQSLKNDWFLRCWILRIEPWPEPQLDFIVLNIFEKT